MIHALNTDMPFDRFTVEQLAGDMLPGATLAQKTATGFHRNTMLNEEGGIDPLEFRFYAVTDRVATTATTWLGLTLGCAQCHTHKYDPIPHRDYYRFMAFLNNADEPTLELPDPGLVRRRREIEVLIRNALDDLPNRFPFPSDHEYDGHRTEAEQRREYVDRAFRRWLENQRGKAVRWTPLTPIVAQANLPRLSIETDGSVLASGDMSKKDVYELKFAADISRISALRLDVLPDDRLPAHGPGRVYYEGSPGDFFLSELSLSTQDEEDVFLKSAGHSYAKPGFEADNAIDGDPQSGWSIDGGQGRSHSVVVRPGRPIERDAARSFRLRLSFERYFAAGLGRFRVSVTDLTGPVADPVLPLEIESLIMLPEGQRTEEQEERLLTYYLSVAPELAPEHAKIERLRKQLPAYPTTLVMQEHSPDHPRPTFLHHRGEYLQPGEKVEPGVLSILPPLPPNAPRDRLSLARWLVAPENPMVGRVTMNRHWARIFGTGIVRTTQDFGYQGDPPSHPGLLDWLAVEFIRQGWSLKKMHRLMVTSATYRQSSHVSPELLVRDPENRLLARGPRVRLEAEMIRDQALRVSGLLFEVLGGPSVFPPQPPGVTTDGAYGKLDWKISPGGNRYRRGLYTFSKRTTPYAMAATFDAPSGEVCIARREVSNTPLQALTLLNDPVFQEAAQTLGCTLAMDHRRGDSERVEHLFQSCLARRPDAEERVLLEAFIKAQRQRFAQHTDQAVALVGPSTDGADVVEAAVWTALARAILNLDEMITKG